MITLNKMSRLLLGTRSFPANGKVHLRLRSLAFLSTFPANISFPFQNLILFGAPGYIEEHRRRTCHSSFVKEIANFDDLESVLSQNSDRLTIVKVTSKACDRSEFINEKFQETAENFPDFVFCEIDINERKHLCQLLGIALSPSLRLYKGGLKGRIEDLPLEQISWEDIRNKMISHQKCLFSRCGLLRFYH
mmetsp:Transcript_4332/g.5976  ORF Transcript_4332/g.5976 Transcript_4332/m.5976 type:complete len:191 (+) Transcript_4332:268-840(+)